jgi:hypothetical protein
MSYLKILFFCTVSAFSVCAQMTNDSTFSASVSHPKFKKGKGPALLIDAAHHNFIVEMGLAKPLVDVATADGYLPKIDSALFTKAYLDLYKVVIITPAMPFKFGSKKEVTTESTFTPTEIDALHEWVSAGGSLVLLSEHAPIDKSMTPVLNKFGIQSSIGIVWDSVYCDKSIQMKGFQTLLKFNKENGLLNMDHPITKGEKAGEQINAIVTYGGSGLTGPGYTSLLNLSPSVEIKRWSGINPSGSATSQGLAGKVGKGKLVALGDCNGFTAMYIPMGAGKNFYAGMQVPNHNWKQFVLNTLHWLSK